MVVLEWLLYIVGGGITAYYSFRHSWWLFPKKISRWKRSRMSDYDFYTDRAVAAFGAAFGNALVVIGIVFVIFHPDSLKKDEGKETQVENPGSADSGYVDENPPVPLPQESSPVEILQPEQLASIDGNGVREDMLPAEDLPPALDTGILMPGKAAPSQRNSASSGVTGAIAERPPMADADISGISALVQQWDEAHNHQNDSLFLSLYVRQVDYYGQRWSSRKCVNDKMRLFRRYGDFRQHSENLRPEKLPDGRMKVSFEKHVRYNGKDETFPSYLVLEQQPDATWRIAAESDEITDHNLKRRKK